jgi:hypothetical protein
MPTKFMRFIAILLITCSVFNNAEAQLRGSDKKIVKIFKDSYKEYNWREDKVSDVPKRKYDYYTKNYSSNSDNDVSGSFWVGAVIGYVAITGGLYATDTGPFMGAKFIDGMIGLPIGGLVGEWIDPDENPFDYDSECYHYSDFSDFAYNVGKTYILTRLHDHYSGNRPLIRGCGEYVRRLLSEGIGKYIEENYYFRIVSFRVGRRISQDFGNESTLLPVEREIEKTSFSDIEKWFGRVMQ